MTVSLFHEKSIPTEVTPVPGACQILNGQERTFAVNRGTNSFTAHFHSVQLKNVKRPDRGKNEELVTEHKYAFVFFSTVTVCGDAFPLKVSYEKYQIGMLITIYLSSSSQRDFYNLLFLTMV